MKLENLTSVNPRRVATGADGEQPGGSAVIPRCVAGLLRRVLLRARNENEKETFFCITELECYCPDDPYTHGVTHDQASGAVATVPAAAGEVVCEQQGPPGCWYFHRAGRAANGNYRAGTFKGLDITCAPEGQAGGILIRSLTELGPDWTPVKRWEGPCVCVNRLLSACGADSIKELVARDDFAREVATSGPPKCLALVARATFDTSAVLAGPRVGLKAPAPGTDPLREEYQPLRARYVLLPMVGWLKKERQRMLAALVSDVGTLEAIRLTGLCPKNFE